jgi:hypothetical protein
MQNSLFDDLKSLKQKMNQEEKVSKEKIIEAQIKEKEEKLQQQFVSFMKNSGVKKIH